MYLTGNRSCQTNLISFSVEITTNSLDVIYSTTLGLKMVPHSDNKAHVKSIKNRLSTSFFLIHQWGITIDLMAF